MVLHLAGLGVAVKKHAAVGGDVGHAAVRVGGGERGKVRAALHGRGDHVDLVVELSLCLRGKESVQRRHGQYGKE